MIEQHTLEAEPGTRDSVGWVARGQGRVPVRGSKGMGGESVTKRECGLRGGKQRATHLTGDVDPDAGADSESRAIIQRVTASH